MMSDNIRRTGVMAVSVLAWLMMAGPVAAQVGWTNVQDYFPEDWEDREQLDLREYIQRAVDENAQVYFPGNVDPDDPMLYHMSPTLEVPKGTRLEFGPNHRIVRLPAAGRLISLQDDVRLTGAIIDGNKYAHWPEYPDLGKSSEAAVWFRNHVVIEDTVVYDNPGHAFFSSGDYNKLYRCRAENIGYIDVRHGRSSYQGAHDAWSADGFYLRGEGNLVKDSEAYDAQRWDFCSSHSGARQNTYVDCRGGDVHFKTYGFIDIENAEGNNRLIRCISPNNRIVASNSPQTEIIQSMASSISGWDRGERMEDGMYEGVVNHGVLIQGNLTTPMGRRYGGLEIGSWGDERPGADSPIVVNNRMYQGFVAPASGYTHWSFSVYSTDGYGVVENNLLFEHEADGERGPGLNLDNIEQSPSNHVKYGQWEVDLPMPKLEWGEVQGNDTLEGMRPRGYSP